MPSRSCNKVTSMSTRHNVQLLNHLTASCLRWRRLHIKADSSPLDGPPGLCTSCQLPLNRLRLFYLSAANHAIPLSTSICISVADSRPLKRLKLLPALLRTSLRLRADLRAPCIFRPRTAQTDSVIHRSHVDKRNRYKSDIHLHAAIINYSSLRFL